MDRLTVYTPDGYESINPIDLELDEYSDINLERILDKLGKYEDEEEQGLLLKLPCKVGDTLYFPYIDDIVHENVISEEVAEIGLYYRVRGGDLSSCSELGKIIFFTREEAEEALKKAGGIDG